MNAKFLIDENISPQSVQFLLGLGLEVFDAREMGLRGQSDEEVYKYAKDNGLILMTFDHEFSYLYLSRKDLAGLIILRVHPQTLENLHGALKRFFEAVALKNIDLHGTISVVEVSRFRFKKVDRGL